MACLWQALEGRSVGGVAVCRSLSSSGCFALAGFDLIFMSFRHTTALTAKTGVGLQWIKDCYPLYPWLIREQHQRHDVAWPSLESVSWPMDREGFLILFLIKDIMQAVWDAIYLSCISYDQKNKSIMTQKQSFTARVLCLLNNYIHASRLFGGCSGHLAQTTVKRRQADYFRVEHTLVIIRISCGIPNWPKSGEELMQCNAKWGLGTHSPRATVMNQATRSSEFTPRLHFPGRQAGHQALSSVI